MNVRTETRRAQGVPDARRGLALWWHAIRPRTLTLATAPVLVGTALAMHQGAGLSWPVFLIALLSAVLIQAGTNLFNDAGDFLRGNDGPERFGPLRVTAAGLATPRQVKRAALVCFLAALAGGVYLVIVGGWPIFGIGVLSLLAGWAYSGGPRPLSHTAFGEVFVMLFFGLVAVAGSHYLQSGQWSAAALIAGGMLGAHAAAVLLVNNVRDLTADTLAGRHTLAAALGVERARRLYVALMLAPYPLLLVLLTVGVAPLAVVPALLTGLMSLRLGRAFLSMTPGPAMNAKLAQTARAQMLLALALTLGLLIA